MWSETGDWVLSRVSAPIKTSFLILTLGCKREVGGLSLENPIKTHENTKIHINQQNPYQYEQIDIQKITQTHQNFET